MRVTWDEATLNRIYKWFNVHVVYPVGGISTELPIIPSNTKQFNLFSLLTHKMGCPVQQNPFT